MAFEEEYHFTLPRGYKDNDGNLHRKGVMRLANAADEILPLKDQRVVANPAYLTIALLARVVVRLGTIETVSKRVIEDLFTADLAYLQDLYERINAEEMPMYRGICPHCGEEVEIPVNFMYTGE